MILPHHTGHDWTPGGELVRADLICGRWVATRFRPDMRIKQQVIATDEVVHALIAEWIAS